MLVIRLSRIGRKDKAVYRVVISENTKDTFGDHLEQLGTYNPSVKPKEIKLEKERIQYWLSQGAQPSATVHNLLVDAGIVEGKKVKASRTKKKSEEELKKEAEEKAAAAEPAEKAEEAKPEESKEEAVSEEKPEEKKEDVKPEEKEEEKTEEKTEEKVEAVEAEKKDE